MSWDIVIFRSVQKGVLPKDWPDDFKPLLLGRTEEIRKQISLYLPGVDWSDPSWGILDGEGFSIEFNMGAEGEIDSIMLHVRGSGDPVSAIAKFCMPNDWAAYDCSTGDYLDFEYPPHRGWEEFQAYRDQVIKRTEP